MSDSFIDRLYAEVLVQYRVWYQDRYESASENRNEEEHVRKLVELTVAIAREWKEQISNAKSSM